VIFFECDGEGCEERAEGSAPQMVSMAGHPMPPVPPPGWRHIEWTEPPPPPLPRIDAPDPTMAALSGVLPHAAVERMKKAVEANRIAQELRHAQYDRFEPAEQRSALLCPKCGAGVRLRRWTRAGTVSIPMRREEPPSAAEDPPPEPPRTH
jgi:hypothetical protein